MKCRWFSQTGEIQIAARGRAALLVVSASALATLTLFLMVWNLGANSISIASDEVIYTRVSQGVLHERAFFPLMHGNVPTFEKPPLKLWLGALAPWLFGESNFSFRVLDGALGVFVVFCAVMLARRLSGSLVGALAVGFLVLSMPEWIIAQHGFRKAVLDGLLTVLTIGIAVAAWRVIEEPRRDETKGLCAIGVLASLAVLTKSVAGFVPLACAVCSIGVIAPRVLWSKRAAWLGLPLIVFATYVLAVWEVGGLRGLRMFLGVEIIDRAFSGFEGHNTGSSWFYMWYLFKRGGAAPRWLLCVGVVGAVVAARRDPKMRYLLVWSFLPVVAYSLSASRAPWYIAPFFPFVCMVAVFGTTSAVEWLGRQPRARSLAPIVCVVVVILSANSYLRALVRNLREVSTDTTRIQIDLLTEKLRNEYKSFGILESAVSGRSNPRNGRFNVEGIYRETLKPDLVIVPQIDGFQPEPGRVYFVKESRVSSLPAGWVEVGRLAQSPARDWEVVAVVYRSIGASGYVYDER